MRDGQGDLESGVSDEPSPDPFDMLRYLWFYISAVFDFVNEMAIIVPERDETLPPAEDDNARDEGPTD